MSCGVGGSGRHNLDHALLWLWCRPAAIALIQPLGLGTSICRRCSPKKIKGKKKRIGWESVNGNLLGGNIRVKGDSTTATI